MIELHDDKLIFAFPEVHPSAKLTVSFQRTLRIPDDDKTYPLPPGLGCFPLRHVDDFAASVPPKWIERGGVMLPMYQCEAMWISFASDFDQQRGVSYPFALKIAAGKVSAVTGRPWKNGLLKKPQDHVVVPRQPWLDGYCIEQGSIRQFVAMPLGAGYTAEEQITGAAEYGGLQLVAFPMKREVFERRYLKRRPTRSRGITVFACAEPMLAGGASMGLAPGGRMKQQIEKDPYDFDDWDQTNGSRCFVHLCNSTAWRGITGSAPPTTPVTAAQYTSSGLPWFDYYSDPKDAVKGSSILDGLKSVAAVAKGKRQQLADNESITPQHVIALRHGLKKAQVREGDF